MKKFIVFLSLSSFLACSPKETEVVPEVTTGTIPAGTTSGTVVTTTTGTTTTMTPDFTKQKKISEGKFVSGVHDTSGIATIYEDANGVFTLVFTKLKSDAGPDLRILLSTDLKATSTVEVNNKVENGDKYYVIPKNADLAKFKNVLIWCNQFSVLFGSAELK